MSTRQTPLDGHADRDAADLQLYMFGSPRIVHAGQPVAISRQQVRALLYRLAARLEPVSRDHLSFLFWPDVPDATARRNLTQLLSHLRRALPHNELFLASTEQVRLNPERVWSDEATFEAVYDTPLAIPNVPALRDAVELYTGRLLEGISFPGEAGEYENWLSAEQQHFERLYLDIVRFLLEADTVAGRHDDAILLAKRYLAVDELAEDVHRQLIQLYALVGDRGAALQQYEACVTALERELGVSPLPETLAIYQAVLDPLLPDSTDDHIENPYKGLHPFEEEDAQLFFGREQLVQMLVQQLTAGGTFERFLAIVGPSGSGKSSLVRAGLIPALRQGALPGSDSWSIASLVPGSDPVAELQAALARENGAPPIAMVEAILADQYGLLRILDDLLPAHCDTELVLIIDQFEENFTLVEDESLRDHLLDNLDVAVTTPASRLRLLITLRADFYRDVLTGRQLGDSLTAHSNGVWGLAFSPDGKTLASGSLDGTVILWDVVTRQRIGRPLVGHTEAAHGVAFRPDGKSLASSGWNEVILWDVNLESWQTRACRIANRTLTQSEWAQFVGPDIPYERVCPERAFSIQPD